LKRQKSIRSEIQFSVTVYEEEEEEEERMFEVDDGHDT
jgi:hypothetical protein